MLSMPPARFAAFDERFRSVDERLRIGHVRRRSSDQLGDLLVTNDVGEPVGADQVEVAGLDREGHGLDVDGWLGADGPAVITDRCGLTLGFLRRQPSCPDELTDQRVVGRELVEDVVAKTVGAGVADVSDRDLACLLVDEQRG